MPRRGVIGQNDEIVMFRTGAGHMPPARLDASKNPRLVEVPHPCRSAAPFATEKNDEDLEDVRNRRRDCDHRHQP